MRHMKGKMRMRRIHKIHVISIILVLTIVMLTCTGCGRNHFRKTLDKYESLVNTYADFVEKYGKNPADGTYPESEFMELMEEWAEVNAEMEKIDADDLSENDLMYFMEVMNRISGKIETIDSGN